MNSLLEMLPLLIPVLGVDAILAAAAAVHVLWHPHYRFGSKGMWLVVVIVLLLIGPMIYFVFGKGDEQ